MKTIDQIEEIYSVSDRSGGGGTLFLGSKEAIAMIDDLIENGHNVIGYYEYLDEGDDGVTGTLGCKLFEYFDGSMEVFIEIIKNEIGEAKKDRIFDIFSNDLKEYRCL